MNKTDTELFQRLQASDIWNRSCSEHLNTNEDVRKKTLTRLPADGKNKCLNTPQTE